MFYPIAPSGLQNFANSGYGYGGGYGYSSGGGSGQGSGSESTYGNQSSFSSERWIRRTGEGYFAPDSGRRRRN